MAMTLAEIKAQLKTTYENVDNIHGISEAKQAVRDVLKTAFYMTDHLQELSAEVDVLQAEKGKK